MIGLRKITTRLFSWFGLIVGATGVVVLCAGAFAHGAPAASRPQGYKDWKSSQIRESSERIKKLKLRLSKAKGASKAALQQDLNQEFFRLDIAKELTIKDYLILHVARLGPRQFRKIAALLSKEEVAQLLEAGVRMVHPPQAHRGSITVQALTN